MTKDIEHAESADPAQGRSGKLGVSGWLLVVVLLGLLAVTAAFAIHAWNMFPGAKLSTDGTIAMVLGIVFSTGLGVLLMGLVFWSNRKGYDR